MCGDTASVHLDELSEQLPDDFTGSATKVVKQHKLYIEEGRGSCEQMKSSCSHFLFRMLGLKRGDSNNSSLFSCSHQFVFNET